MKQVFSPEIDGYFGGSGGFGLGRRFSTITNDRIPDTKIWELVHADLVAGYQPTTLFQLGLRVAIFAYDSPMQEDFEGGFVGGAVGGVWLGWCYLNLQFGRRLEVVEVLDGESRLGILWQPLTVRVILAWGDTTPD